MNDEGLVRVALPESDEGEVAQPAFPDDVTAVIRHIEATSDVA